MEVPSHVFKLTKDKKVHFFRVLAGLPMGHRIVVPQNETEDVQPPH